MNKLFFDFSKEKVFFFIKEDWILTIDGNRVITNPEMLITHTEQKREMTLEQYQEEKV